MPSPTQTVTDAVLSSRKYQTIAPELVEAIAAAELGKGRSLKEAVKATKNQLHQSAAVYQVGRLDYPRWLAELSAAWTEEAERRSVLRRLMGSHTSTSERLPFLDDFYTRLFALLPPIHSVLDIACGLNPLALPWMPLPAQATYRAVDIFSDQIAFLNDFFSPGRCGWRGRDAQCSDRLSWGTGRFGVDFKDDSLSGADREGGRGGSIGEGAGALSGYLLSQPHSGRAAEGDGDDLRQPFC